MPAIKRFTSAVGIKELKDQASSIIEQVQKTRKPITITKNNHEVARIVPIAPEQGKFDFVEHFKQLGMLARPSLLKVSELVLEPTGLDGQAAIDAILEDRESD